MKGQKFRILLIAIGCWLCAQTAVAQKSKKYEIGLGLEPDKQVVYLTPETGDPLQLHIFLPDDFSEDKKYPGVIFFFGGGWMGGTASQFFGQSAYLASRGMVAISADYRVKNRHGTPPRVSAEDAKEAIRYIRENANALSIDPEKIVAGGGSAGGHVAAATAFCLNIDRNKDSPISCAPNALVLYNPVYDNGPDGYGHRRVRAYWEDMSPLHNIRSNLPPTLVLMGTNDRHVPVATAQMFQEKMESADNECETHFFEGREHGFFNMNRNGARSMFVETLVKVDAFLVKHGFISGENRVDPWLRKVLGE